MTVTATMARPLILLRATLIPTIRMNTSSSIMTTMVMMHLPHTALRMAPSRTVPMVTMTRREFPPSIPLRMLLRLWLIAFFDTEATTMPMPATRTTRMAATMMARSSTRTIITTTTRAVMTRATTRTATSPTTVPAAVVRRRTRKPSATSP